MNCKLRFYSTLCAFVLITLAPAVRAQTVNGIAAVRVASGVDQPLFVTAPPGDFNRLFIVSRTGRISILNLATGQLNQAAYLDIGGRISSTGERGLLGMAFDPNYATNGKFYLNFVVPGGSFDEGKTRISQFNVLAKNQDVANQQSEKILLAFDQIGGDHNGGWIGFSPRDNDGNNLYIATGDGGCCNDQGDGHFEPGGNAQSLTTLLGKMLRINVHPATATYTIPSNNPFVNTAGARPEIWAFGLRNPFRDSFDRLTGRMFIADVGQNTREEIDVQEATHSGGGENYEWRLREGTIATPTGNPPVGGDRPPDGVDPIFDYDRSTGGSVIGGYVYRGKQIPALQGRYVFGDYLDHRIFLLNYDGTTASNLQNITSQLFPTASGNFSLGAPASFGEDANGELYICDIVNDSIFKIVPATPNVQIDSVTRDGISGQIIIEGTGVPFTNVTLEASPNITQSFTSLASVMVAGDATFTFQDATGLATRFYRVRYP